MLNHEQLIAQLIISAVEAQRSPFSEAEQHGKLLYVQSSISDTLAGMKRPRLTSSWHNAARDVQHKQHSELAL